MSESHESIDTSTSDQINAFETMSEVNTRVCLVCGEEVVKHDFVAVSPYGGKVCIGCFDQWAEDVEV
jgi:formylmethanofuran dehydrogenase subunit E